MATTANLWRANLPGFIAPPVGGINWLADNIMCALYTSAWTPSLDVATGYSNINEVASGYGYAQGGVAIGSKSAAYTAANSYGQLWAATTAYNVGDIIRPLASPNGHLYMCVAAGTTGGTEPTWIIGRGATQPSDGTVTWVECGLGVFSLTCATPAWTVTGTITFQYVAFYDASATSPVSKPYVLVINFGATQTGSASGSMTLPVDINGLIVIPVY